MMWRMDIDPSELKNAVERMHHCSARLIQSVPIREWFEHETVWEGAVHIFDLEGHPTASRAYAWSSSIEGSDNRRFFAVLHQPPITSPVDAVRAAIVAEQGITLEVRRCIKSQSTGRALDSGFGGTGDASANAAATPPPRAPGRPGCTGEVPGACVCSVATGERHTRAGSPPD